jgi:predicted transcriptional regulator
VNESENSRFREMQRELAEVKNSIKELKEKTMTTQAQLDAAIAALPGLIETAVETALQPVIAAIEAAGEANEIDFTNEVNSLNAIPAAVSASVAAAVTPAAPATPPAGS